MLLMFLMDDDDDDDDAHLQRVTWNQMEPRKPRVLEDHLLEACFSFVAGARPIFSRVSTGARSIHKIEKIFSRTTRSPSAIPAGHSARTYYCHKL